MSTARNTVATLFLFWHRLSVSHWWHWVLLPLSYTVLALPLYWSTFAHWGSALATRCVERCDTAWQNVWSLWWVAHQIAQFQPVFYTDRLFYPGGAEMFFQTLMVANGIIMAPVTLVFGPIAAFNTLSILTIVLSGWSMAVCSERIVQHAGASWIAGILYTFAPFHIWHAYGGFVERMPLQYFPILLYALWELAQRPRWQMAILTTCSILGALYSSLYYGLFSITYVAIWALIITYQNRHARALVWQIWQQLIIIAGLASIAVLPFAWRTIFPGRQVSTMDSGIKLVDFLERQMQFSNQILTLVTPSITSPLYGKSVSAWYLATTGSYFPVTVGLGVVVLAIIGILVARQQIASWLFVMCCIVVVLSFGPYLRILDYNTRIPLPYFVLNQIPIVKLGQRPDHFLLLGLAHLAIFAALAIRTALQRINRPWPWIIIGTGLLCVDLYSAPLQSFWASKSVVYDTIKPHEPGAVLILPFDLDDGNTMYAQWYLQRNILTGYMPRLNPEMVNTGLVFFADGIVQGESPQRDLSVLHTDSATALLDIMQALDVEYVIYDKRFKRALDMQVFRRLERVADDEQLTLYRRPGDKQIRPFAVLHEGWFPKESRAGQTWQWSDVYGAFFVYNTTRAHVATIIHATLWSAQPNRVTLDGEQMKHPITFTTMQSPRKYQFLTFSPLAATNYWFYIPNPSISTRRLLGVALEQLTVRLTRLSLDSQTDE